MKALLAIVLLAIVCIVLFVAGVISQRRSKKMQETVDKWAKKGEIKSDQNAGKLGDMTQEGLEKMRRAADASARAGRKVNERLTE